MSLLPHDDAETTSYLYMHYITSVFIVDKHLFLFRLPFFVPHYHSIRAPLPCLSFEYPKLYKHTQSDAGISPQPKWNRTRNPGLAV